MSFNKSEALEAAKQYVLQRNLPAALEIFQEIVQSDPTDLAALNTLGDLCASTGSIKDAIDHFSRLSTVYIEGGFSRKAIATLKKIIAIDPANIETAIRLADLYAAAGLPSEARQHYLQIAEALTRKGQRLDALGVYTKVVELDPMNTPTRIKLGELCIREGLNDQAYDAFMIAADQLAQKGESRRALNAYNEALSIKPGSAEAMTASRKLMEILGVAERPPSTKTPDTGESGAEKSVATRTAPARTPAADDTPKSNENSFVVQEISKAEILVAYGQVSQALGMLRNVLRETPDNIDVHIKLKDIYLRTGMMSEAAIECRELERIHQSRGESDRARDYAVRASRLTQLLEQPSGDLERVQSKKAQPNTQTLVSPAAVVTQTKTPTNIAAQTTTPATKGSEAPAAPVHSAVAPAARSQATLSSIQATSVAGKSPGTTPALVAPKPDSRPPAPPRQAAPIGPKPVTTRIDLPVAHSNPMTISVAEEKPRTVGAAALPQTIAKASSLIEKHVAAAKLEAHPIRQSSLAVITAQRRDVSSPLSLTPATEPFIEVKRKRRKLTAAAISAGAVVLLGISAVVGGFVYNSHLDKQYSTLSVTPQVVPPPPDAVETEEPQPQTVQNDTPISITVTAGATAPAPGPRESREAEPTKPQPTPMTAVQPGSQPVKALAPPAPVLPRASFSSESGVGADNKAPVDVPIGTTQPGEPPARLVRQSPGVVVGSAIKKVDPVYPSAARSAGQVGAVKVEVSINERGDVVAARALSGPSLLQAAAVNAARAWKFKASTLGGLPVATTTTIVFNFKL